MPEPSVLDARLAEIDRRLRTIQSGLAPESEPPGPTPSFPAPTLVAPPPAPVGVADPQPPPAAGPAGPVASGDDEAAHLVTALRELVQAQERWLAAARELLAASAAPSASVVPPASAAPPGAAAPPVPAPLVSVSAGPFGGTEALRRFERSLATLPEVRQAAIREYQGEDHAIVDVHLFGPTS